MTFHEAMHGYVSYWLGDDTALNEGRLTINPIKHIDPVLSVILPLLLAIVGAPIFGGAKPMPFSPHNVRWGEWGAALIAVSGPLTNLLIAFVAFGIMSIFNIQVLIYGNVLSTIVLVNLGFFVFNMLPIPPLDGSRVIYALAPDFVRRGMEFFEQYGIIVVFIIVILASGPLLNFMQGVIALILSLFQAFFSL
jgi:Zn-dependent protease